MTQDPAIRRLRWLMCGVILFDHALTFIGQPSSYWRDPSTAQEYNAFAAWFMHRGYLVGFAASLAWAAGAFALVTFLPRRLAWFALMIFLFSHFTAGAGWIMYRFRFGTTGLYFYSFALAAAFVLLGSDGKKPNQSPEPTAPSGRGSP